MVKLEDKLYSEFLQALASRRSPHYIFWYTYTYMYVYGHQDQSHNPCILTLCIHQEYVSWLEVQNNKIIPTLNTNCIELVCYIFFFLQKLVQIIILVQLKAYL